MKPDNITRSPMNPQSWNLYSYVNGNPVNFNDPLGHFINPPHSTKVVLAGVPAVDISGMLTAVEIYEWFGGNILYGDFPTAEAYYQNSYLSSQSVSGRLNASHEEFSDWVSDLKTKGLNFDVETTYYLKSIYQMSKEYGGELAFYISPTRNNGLAIIVIFGKETEVNPYLSPKEAKFFSKTLGFDWHHFFIHGHTHPAEGTINSKGEISILGASQEDVDAYCKMALAFPWNLSLIIQQDQNSEIVVMLIIYYPWGPSRETAILP